MLGPNMGAPIAKTIEMQKTTLGLQASEPAWEGKSAYCVYWDVVGNSGIYIYTYIISIEPI